MSEKIPHLVGRSLLRRGLPAAVLSGVVLGTCGDWPPGLAWAADPPPIRQTSAVELPAAPPTNTENSAPPAKTDTPAPPANTNTPAPPANTPTPADNVPATEGTSGDMSYSTSSLPLSELLGTEVAPIDLASALSMAGVQNPEMLIARQRIVEAVAERQLAAATLLPSLRAGLSYDDHTGPLQQSFGNILSLHRSALYVGAGSYAIAAGSVNIPGVFWENNISQWIVDNLQAMTTIEQRQFHSRAVENQVLLRVAVGYNNLLRTVGMKAVRLQNVDDALEVVRLTDAYVQAGGARQADADRARGTARVYVAQLQNAEGQLLIASATLAELLSLDPSIRLQPIEDRYVPMPMVPDPIPLRELVAIAVMQRPELQERQAVIQKAMLALHGQRVLPFSPTVIVGFSAGGEGGGSNLVHQSPAKTDFGRNDPNFGNWSGRQDFDVVGYWMLKNLGVGNLAAIREAESKLHISNFELLAELDKARAEVARGYARSHARFAQIKTAEEAVRTAEEGFEEDKRRILGRQGLPIELLDDLRLLTEAREQYLRAITNYNEAQLQLYVSLGNPPADMLARPVPLEGVKSPGAAEGSENSQTPQAPMPQAPMP